MEAELLQKLNESKQAHGIDGGNELLFETAQNGDLFAVQYLLDHGHALIDATDDSNNNALFIAITAGQYFVVKFILNNLPRLLTIAGQGDNPLELLNRTNQFNEDTFDCLINLYTEHDVSICLSITYIVLKCYERYSEREDLIAQLQDFLARGIEENVVPQEVANFLKKIYPELDPAAPLVVALDNLQLPMDEQTGQHLYLDTLANPYIISMAPMNSSGDIYHVLAYIILARSHNKTSPVVHLTYDSAQVLQILESKLNSYSQTQRSLNFVRQLGYDQFFPNPNPINAAGADNGHRQNHRQIHLKDTLREHFPNHNYIDQKALTVLIAYHFQRHGFENTTARLRQGFSQSTLAHDLIVHINNEVNNQIARIQARNIHNRPILIIQMRYSSKANNEQNVEERIVPILKNYLEQQGYFVWFIGTDGRIQSSFNAVDEGERTYLFPYYINNNRQTDYGKILHLRLLIRLQALPNLRGIIGNTSGTLDVAAFVGHRVYNLHEFNNQINYQAYRILIQTAFLSIEELNTVTLYQRLAGGALTDALVTEFFTRLRVWLNAPQNPLLLAPRTFLRIGNLPDATAANVRELFYYQNLTTGHQGAILGNTITVSGMATDKINQNHFNELLTLMRTFNYERFQQRLSELRVLGFDSNFVGEAQQTLLQWALNLGAAPEAVQNKLALILVTVSLLKPTFQVFSVQSISVRALYLASRGHVTPEQVAFETAVLEKLENPPGKYFAPGY